MATFQVSFYLFVNLLGGTWRAMTWWLAIIMLALSFGATESLRTTTAETSVLRLNYGVHFRAVRQVHVVTDYWAQVFHVQLPTVPRGSLHLIVPTCAQLNLRSCHALRKLLVKAHHLYVEMTNEVRSSLRHIKQILPTRVENPRHTRRSLLPIGGWLLHSVFGTTTDSDLKPIHKQVNRIAHGLAQVAQGLEVEDKRLAGFMSLQNHRIDNLVNMTVVQREAINKLTEELSSAMGNSVTIQAAVSFMSQKIVEYTKILNKLQEFRTGVELLTHGLLSPIVIDKSRLHRTLDVINEHLSHKFPRLYPIIHRTSDYYNLHDFVFGRHEDHLLVQLHIPLSPVNADMTLYEIETFPCAVPNEPGHVTTVMGLPRFIVSRRGYPYYILPTREATDRDVSLFLNLVKTRDPFRSFRNAPSCASALFENDRAKVQSLCQFQIHVQPLQPTIRFLTDTDLLLLNATNVIAQCDRKTEKFDFCLMCVHKVDCDCKVTLMDENDNAMIYFMPRVGTCDATTNMSVAGNMINMAVLQNFFNDSELASLEGDTLLSQPLKVRLPKFRKFQHQFKELISSDATDRYNLHKFAERVKKDQIVYHHLADVVAANMKDVEINSGSDYFDTDGWTSSSFYLKWLSLIMSIISFIFALFLFYRVRIIAAALALSSVAKAEEVEFPDELNFQFETDPKISEPLPETIVDSINNTLLLDEWHYNIMASISTMLLALMIVYVYYLYKKADEDNLYTVLEIGNAKRVTRIKALKLPHAFFVYNFSARVYFQCVAVQLLPPSYICNGQALQPVTRCYKRSATSQMKLTCGFGTHSKFKVSYIQVNFVY